MLLFRCSFSLLLFFVCKFCCALFRYKDQNITTEIKAKRAVDCVSLHERNSFMFCCWRAIFFSSFARLFLSRLPIFALFIFVQNLQKAEKMNIIQMTKKSQHKRCEIWTVAALEIRNGKSVSAIEWRQKCDFVCVGSTSNPTHINTTDNESRHFATRMPDFGLHQCIWRRTQFVTLFCFFSRSSSSNISGREMRANLIKKWFKQREKLNSKISREKYSKLLDVGSSLSHSHLVEKIRKKNRSRTRAQNSNTSYPLRATAFCSIHSRIPPLVLRYYR